MDSYFKVYFFPFAHAYLPIGHCGWGGGGIEIVFRN